MPKIAAPTVREHHEMVKTRLVEATERILREEGASALTAAAVAKEANIARNSIYRYVESVDDLKMLALESFVPRWVAKIGSQVDLTADPADQLADFAAASVLETANRTHGSLVATLRTSTGKPGKAAKKESAGREVRDVHARVDAFIRSCFEALGAENPELWTGFARSIIYESFKAGEQGRDVETVASELRVAVKALANQARTIPPGQTAPVPASALGLPF